MFSSRKDIDSHSNIPHAYNGYSTVFLSRTCLSVATIVPSLSLALGYPPFRNASQPASQLASSTYLKHATNQTLYIQLLHSPNSKSSHFKLLPCSQIIRSAKFRVTGLYKINGKFNVSLLFACIFLPPSSLFPSLSQQGQVCLTSVAAALRRCRQR